MTDLIWSRFERAPTITGSLIPEWIKYGQTNSVASMFKNVDVFANPFGELIKVLRVIT